MKPYFKRKNFKLYKGDCLEVMRQMKKESFDLVFADPPYRLSKGGTTVHSGERASVDKGAWDKSLGLQRDFEFTMQWLKECKRLLKPNGSIFVTGTYHSIYICGHAMQLLGYHILNDICWYKPNCSPNIGCRNFTASHESIIWAKKSEKVKHCFNYDLMKNGNWGKDFIKRPSRQMRDVWAIATPGKKEKSCGRHPAQKPLELLKRIILASTNEGNNILDPFTGSGTTGICSVLLKRKFTGIDKYIRWMKLSVKRYEQIKSNPSYFKDLMKY